MISYLKNLKSGISYIIYDNYGKTKINSADDLPLAKTLILCNVAILIKTDLNKRRNQCYCNIYIFLENWSSDQLVKKRMARNFFDRIIMLGFGKTNVVKYEFYGAKTMALSIWLDI